MLYGVNPKTVISAIKDRSARYKKGDHTSDGRRLGLVIEGGALRAVCSAGGAYALAELGFAEVFDEVYATSAGVMNASYFLSEQPLLGIRVYFENCTNARFVNKWRLWKIIDVDYIFDQVVPVEKPLNVQKVLGSRSHLYVAVIDKPKGEAFLVNTKLSRTPLVQILKAANAIPIFYNRTVEVDGRKCIDGGLGIPFPILQALSNGCTDILVLSTRPVDYVGKRPNWAKRTMFDLISARGNAGMNRLFNERHLRSVEIRDLAFGRGLTRHVANIATFCTEGKENIDRMTTDRAVLYSAANSYGQRVFQSFTSDESSWGLPAVLKG